MRLTEQNKVQIKTERQKVSLALCSKETFYALKDGLGLCHRPSGSLRTIPGAAPQGGDILIGKLAILFLRVNHHLNGICSHLLLNSRFHFA